MGRVDQERLAAWREFLRAHATITQALEGELLRAHDLPLAWYDVLVSLNDAPHGRLRMQELARSVMFSRSGLTRLVGRMVHAGLLTREPCPGDRRGTFAVITSDGRKRLRAASGVHLRGVYEHFGVPMPLMYPRASATLLDSAAVKFLTKCHLPLEALQGALQESPQETLNDAAPLPTAAATSSSPRCWPG